LDRQYQGDAKAMGFGSELHGSAFYTAKSPSRHEGSYAITKFHFDLHQIRGPRAHLDFNAVLAFRTRLVSTTAKRG
jgi:hypothetical protein